MKPFFTFFGGKYRIALHYPHPTGKIIEPFAGSAGYSVRHAECDVTLYDVDPKLFGVWDYLIHTKASEILKLPLIVEHTDLLKVCQEAKWLIGFWLNKGTTQPCKQPGKWMREYKSHQNSYWGEVVRQRIASQVEDIKHWKVFNKTYLDVPNKKATYFVDPPYARSGIAYKYNKVEYSVLAQFCKTRNGPVIVCEQAGASWLPFKPFRKIKTLEGAHGTKKGLEVIWTKGVK